jgi:Uma2 family endonuclease
MITPTFKTMSVEDYLKSEDESLWRREYVGGFVYPLHGAAPDQDGTTAAHNLISGSIAAVLHPAASRLGDYLYGSQLKLFIEATRCFLYPDLMLVAKTEPFEPDSMYVSNPYLIVEIISEHTEFRDRVAKYGLYTAIPSLQTYLIVEQDERRVYAYTREAEGWQMQELIGQGNIYLPCLGRSLSLDEIYDGVL